MRILKPLHILKIYTLLCVATLGFCTVLPPAAKAEPESTPSSLKVAVSAPCPPFSYMDRRGTWIGFDVEIARAICKEMNIQCEIVPMPFRQIIPSIQQGEVDMAVAGIGSTPEREKDIIFSERYYRSRSIYIVHRDSLGEISTNTLARKRLCTVGGTLQEQYLEKNFGESSTILAADTVLDVFKSVSRGEADAGLVEGLSGYYLLKQPESEELESLGELVIVDGTSHHARIAISPKWPFLEDKANDALKEIRSNGEYSKINRKYFDFSIY